MYLALESALDFFSYHIQYLFLKAFSLLGKHERDHTIDFVADDELHDCVEKLNLPLLHRVHTLHHLLLLASTRPCVFGSASRHWVLC